MAALTLSPDQVTRVKALGFLINKGTDNFNCRIITINGKISSEQLEHISKAAKLYGNGEVTFTTRLTIELPGVPYDKIDEIRSFLMEKGLETGGTGSKVRPIVSCKGTSCQYGLIDTFAISEEIHYKFYKGYGEVKTPHKFKIAVGGCPNNCVKPDLNDIGIIGQLIPIKDLEKCMGCLKCSVETICPVKAARVNQGKLEIDESLCNNCGRCIKKCSFKVIENGIPGYTFYIGGMWGKNPLAGKKINKVYTNKEDIYNFIENAILYYRENGKTGERFGKTIQRLGFEKVEKDLIEMESLKRKDEIIKAKLHGSGGASC